MRNIIYLETCGKVYILGVINFSMKKLTKTEYEILYYISIGRNSIERLEGMFESKDILNTINNLEKMGLIKISYREGRIYGFMETSQGENFLTDSEYTDWYEECGD